MSNGQPPGAADSAPPTVTTPSLQPLNYTQQNQPPYASYVIQPPESEASGKLRPIPGVKYFGIVTVIIAFLLSVFGIVAIVLEAKDSYVGNPIWTGVLFVLPTGLLGLTSYWKRTSLCTNVSYLVFSILTCIVCSQLIIYSSINALREPWRQSLSLCAPSPDDYNYHYYGQQWDDDACPFSRDSRVGIDATIALLAFCQFVLGIITLSFTCYGTFTCCYNCCRSPPPPAVVQYSVQNGACQLRSVGGHHYQSPTTAYQPVSLVVPVGTNGQMVPQQAAPVMAHPQMQTHTVMIAAPSQQHYPPAQNPHHQGTPPAKTSATLPTEKPSQVPEEPTESENAEHEDLNVAYGQTTSEQFNDEQNLI